MVIIRRWTTEFLCSDGRDVYVEWAGGDQYVIVLENDTHTHTVPVNDLGTLDAFVCNLLRALELARLRQHYEAIEDDIDRRNEQRLDDAWADGPTDEELETIERLSLFSVDEDG